MRRIRSRADGSRWPELAISRMRCSSSSELCSTSRAAASPADVPDSMASRNDSTSWLRSPMARMPAMRAPPLSVCSNRFSSVTCARSARSARQRPNAASACSSSSVASSPKIAAMSASKSSPSPASSSSGSCRLNGAAGGSSVARPARCRAARPALRAEPCGRCPASSERIASSVRCGSDGSVSSSADNAAASSMTTDRSGRSRACPASTTGRACARLPPRASPAPRRAGDPAPPSPPSGASAPGRSRCSRRRARTPSRAAARCRAATRAPRCSCRGRCRRACGRSAPSARQP